MTDARLTIERTGFQKIGPTNIMHVKCLLDWALKDQKANPTGAVDAVNRDVWALKALLANLQENAKLMAANRQFRDELYTAGVLFRIHGDKMVELHPDMPGIARNLWSMTNRIERIPDSSE